MVNDTGKKSVSNSKAAINMRRMRAQTGRNLGLTPGAQYYYYYGEDGNVYMGAFLPGLTKFFKKAGKAIGSVVRPITTSIAKTILPSGVVDAIAKLDPTRKGNTMQAAAQAASTLISSAIKPQQVVKTEAQIQQEAAIKTALNPMMIAIVGAGALALLVISRRKR